MEEMEVKQYVVGPVATNCYFVIHKKTKEMLLIDPGASREALAEKIKQEGLHPVAILLTHGHFDHASEAAGLAEMFHIFVYASEDEKETLESPGRNLSTVMKGHTERYRADRYLKDKEKVNRAGFDIQVLCTPGHTPGGCCY